MENVFHTTSDDVQYVAVRREIGGFAPYFIRVNFQAIGIAALSLGLKPRHAEKFREC